MRPCSADHPDPGVTKDVCRVCYLYCVREEYRRLWQDDGTPVPRARSLPCLFLGEVLDRLGCQCPARWLRACALHKVTTLIACKDCKDYQET
jgi:hypothetical protein